MDNKTTIKQLQEIVKQFCEKRDWDQFHNPKDLAIGISTEANELLQIFRFKTCDDMSFIMNSTKRNAVEEEIADIFYFLLRFAQMNDIDLSSALLNKLQENEQKYPIEKSKGSNKKYNE